MTTRRQLAADDHLRRGVRQEEIRQARQRKPDFEMEVDTLRGRLTVRKWYLPSGPYTETATEPMEAQR